jgi:hypothetical protein
VLELLVWRLANHASKLERCYVLVVSRVIRIPAPSVLFPRVEYFKSPVVRLVLVHARTEVETRLIDG